MESSLNVWIMLFIAAAAQGIFLSVLLFVQKKKHKRKYWALPTLMILFTLTLAYYVAFWAGYQPRLPGFLSIAMDFTYLFGPLLFYYLFPDKRASFVPQLLPFLLVLIVKSPVFFGVADAVRINSVSPMLQCIHLAVYIGIFQWLIARQNDDVLAFKRQATWAFTGYALCFITYYVMVWTGTLQLQYDYMVSFGMTVFIYFIGYKGFKNPAALLEAGDSFKYEKSGLANSAAKAILEQLDQVMTSKKLFVNGDLKIQDVSRELGISTNKLSQAVNGSKGLRFTDYLNELRVNEAIELMQKKEYEDMKLLAVALDAGFNNKTSFLNAFKKQTGQSPSEFRRQLLRNAS